MILWAGLLIIGLALLIFGLLYAWVIYRAPIDRTWLEVAYGVGATILGEMLLITLTLWSFGLLGQLWPMIFIPPGCYALTGLPQIGFQEYKFREMKKRGKEKKDRHNNG